MHGTGTAHTRIYSALVSFPNANMYSRSGTSIKQTNLALDLVCIQLKCSIYRKRWETIHANTPINLP